MDWIPHSDSTFSLYSHPILLRRTLTEAVVTFPLPWMMSSHLTSMLGIRRQM